MRIIAGNNKGKQILTIKGKDTRPTSDRVKENLFNIIQSLQTLKKLENWQNIIAMDCFSGSGALGLECLSRGANFVSFIDIAKATIDICQKNINSCKFKNYQIIKTKLPLEKPLKQFQIRKHNLVFLDPPYGQNLGVITINSIIKYNLVTKDCLFILETDRKQPEIIPDNLEVLDERIYGRTKIEFIKQAT